MSTRPQDEIDDVLNWCIDEGHFPGMSYEDGVRAAIEWLTGTTEDRPDSD